MQLEAQLADRNVTIELADEARNWLVEHGYDEAMGARPMARLIQSTIKTPLADVVLFGKLKSGGAVRVIVTKSDDGKEALGFEYPDGPIKPRPEKDVTDAVKKRVKRKPRAFVKKAIKAIKPKGSGGNGGGGVRTVPKSAARSRMTTDLQNATYLPGRPGCAAQKLPGAKTLAAPTSPPLGRGGDRVAARGDRHRACAYWQS
jgi:hypothetical protein